MTDAPEPNSPPADELQILWQAQSVEVSPMFLADVHKRAVRFETMQRWNLIAFALIAVFGIGLAGFVMLKMNDGVLSVGYSLAALGVLFAFYYRHNRNPANPQALAGDSQACFDFYKDILKRRIKLARTAWAWAMLPVVPGAIVIFYRAHQMAEWPHPYARIRSAQADLIFHGLEIFLVAALAVRFLMQQRRARRLKRELEALDA